MTSTLMALAPPPDACIPARMRDSQAPRWQHLVGACCLHGRAVDACCSAVACCRHGDLADFLL